MSAIDWNDPDFTSKYQTRGGKPILAVHCLPDWLREVLQHPIFIKHADGKLVTHTIHGYEWDEEPGDYDIVPIPREPITVEGWVVLADVLDKEAYAVLIRDSKSNERQSWSSVPA